MQSALWDAVKLDSGTVFGGAVTLFYASILFNVGGFARFLTRRAVFAFDREQRIGRRRMALLVSVVGLAGVALGVAMTIESARA